MVQAIDNSNLKSYRQSQGTVGFVPKLSYTFDAAAKELDLVHDSDFPAGVALKRVHIRVHDKFGGEVRGHITPAGGSLSPGDADTTIDLTGLDFSKPLDITATIIADDDQLVADGGAYNIGAAGEVGNWDAQRNANVQQA